MEKMYPQLDKKHPYKVPERYFEDFQTRMMNMAASSGAGAGVGVGAAGAPVITMSRWTRLKPYVAMAASFLLLVSLGGLLLKWITPASEELDEQELYSYYCDIIPHDAPDAIFFAEGDDYYYENEE